MTPVEEPKKKYRGWPKGKPRGPRTWKRTPVSILKEYDFEDTKKEVEEPLPIIEGRALRSGRVIKSRP